MGENGRPAYAPEHLFDDDRGKAPPLRTAGVRHRLHSHQPRTERTGRREQRRRTGQAGFRQLGHAAAPRERQACRVVDGEAREAHVFIGQRRVDGVEEAACGGGIAGSVCDRGALRRDAGRNPAERVGAGGEALPELGFNPRKRIRVRRPEVRPLVRPAAQTDDQRGDEAGAHQTPDDVHHSLLLAGPHPARRRSASRASRRPQALKTAYNY